jgi:hypothetical protein
MPSWGRGLPEALVQSSYARTSTSTPAAIGPCLASAGIDHPLSAANSSASRALSADLQGQAGPTHLPRALPPSRITTDLQELLRNSLACLRPRGRLRVSLPEESLPLPCRHPGCPEQLDRQP